MEELKNWHLERDEQDLAWLGLDKPDADANVLSSEVMGELASALDALEATPPRALIIYSAKASGLAAGADVDEFEALTGPEQAYAAIRAGQTIMDRVEALPFPTVAMINGFALGGGLELALACDYRVITDSSKTRLGLPEVMLGIHPGFGGTVRAVQTTGVLVAMDMMLTGRHLRPDKARASGLVDKVVAVDDLRRATQAFALNPPPRRTPDLKDRLLGLAPVRMIVAGQMRKRVARKARPEHYPAPYAIIDLWQKCGAKGARAYEEEARSVARLMCTETSRNLVRVFRLQRELKALGSDSQTDFKRVHVVGAGVMGGDIASWCALKGLDLSLQDREEKYVQAALARAADLFDRKLRDPVERQDARERLRSDVAGEHVGTADVVIEAIFEDLDAKQALYRALEPAMKPGSVLATNTSSLMLEKLGGSLSDPRRLIGLHFFNPVAKMPLIEVVHSTETRPADLAKGLAFAKRIDRLPLPCRSSPGFVVNRVLAPYMMEAGMIAEDGVPYAAIDRAAVDFGMPMGPIELADTVGLDVGLQVASILSEKLDIPRPRRMQTLVDAGRLGRKTGSGFYEYKDGRPVKESIKSYEAPSDLAERMILPLLNECVAVLREGVVNSADLLDAGIIFGTGFAPFRGGPLHYAKRRGVDEIVSALKKLQMRYGDRFSPDVGWRQIETRDVGRAQSAEPDQPRPAGT